MSKERGAPREMEDLTIDWHMASLEACTFDNQ